MEPLEKKLARVVNVAQAYGNLKLKLSTALVHDRVAYTEAKTDLVGRVTNIAKGFYLNLG